MDANARVLSSRTSLLSQPDEEHHRNPSFKFVTVRELFCGKRQLVILGPCAICESNSVQPRLTPSPSRPVNPNVPFAAVANGQVTPMQPQAGGVDQVVEATTVFATLPDTSQVPPVPQLAPEVEEHSQEQELAPATPHQDGQVQTAAEGELAQPALGSSQVAELQDLTPVIDAPNTPVASEPMQLPDLESPAENQVSSNLQSETSNAILSYSLDLESLLETPDMSAASTNKLSSDQVTGSLTSQSRSGTPDLDTIAAQLSPAHEITQRVPATVETVEQT